MILRPALVVALASAALIAATTGSRAFDTGWGAPYNSHLDPYDGRPLGPPLATLPPGYQYYNRRLIWVPYAGARPLYVPSPRPRHAARLSPSRPLRRR